MPMEFDTESIIKYLFRVAFFPRNAGTTTRNHHLNRNEVHISFCLSEIEFVAGNRGVAVSATQGAQEPSPCIVWQVPFDSALVLAG